MNIQKLKKLDLPLIAIAIPLFAFVNPQIAKLEHENNSSQNSAPGTELKSRLKVGGNYTHVNLKPHGNPSFRGNLGGAQGLYEYRSANCFYGAAKLDWKEGRTHGDGKRSLLYIDVQERLGYTFGSSDWLLTLFSGFGYRHLGHKLEKHGSLRLRYNEFYFPVGLITDYNVNSWFAVGLGFTWMPQVFPTVTISPLKGARWKLTNTLDNFSVEFPFDFTLTENKRFHLIFSPFYEHWQDGHTTAKSSTGEKLGLRGNSYNFWGALLNFGYYF